MIPLFFNADTDQMREDAQFWALMFFALAVCTSAGQFLAIYCFGVITETLGKSARDLSFSHMLELDVTWYDSPKNTAGTLTQQLSTDSRAIKGIAGERAATSAAQIVTLTVSMALAFYYCWEMTLVMMALFPAIGVGFAIQHVFVTSMSKTSVDATKDAGSPGIAGPPEHPHSELAEHGGGAGAVIL